MSDVVKLAEIPEVFERWLAGQPFAERSRRESARNVRFYCADPAERARIADELNKGETLPALRRHLVIGSRAHIPADEDDRRGGTRRRSTSWWRAA
jgi:hypothetical protein